MKERKNGWMGRRVHRRESERKGKERKGKERGLVHRVVLLTRDSLSPSLLLSLEMQKKSPMSFLVFFFLSLSLESGYSTYIHTYTKRIHVPDQDLFGTR